MEKIEELEKQLLIFSRRNLELSDEVAFLEAEVLALGNILINSGLVKKEDLFKMTDLVLRQRMIERQNERNSSPFHLTKNELEEAASK